MSLAVVVPAADEQAVIGRCLDGIAVAVTRLRAEYGPLPVRVVVVLDGCRDGTSGVVRDHHSVVGTLGVTYRCVGRSRAAGARLALRGLPDDAVLASTDADSLVPEDWLAGLWRLTRISDLVLGTVVPDGALHDRGRDAWFARHVLTDGHPYVHGANLGIIAGAYRRLGGWRPLASGEDVDLAERARAAQLRVHSTAALPVLTSARRVGRVPHGFATYVRALDGSL